MLDPQTYRIYETLAKKTLLSWRDSLIHHLGAFEASGFPVRISSINDISQILDTMQENRFPTYIEGEFTGLSESEFKNFSLACLESIEFQLIYLPQHKPILPLSTLISCFAIYDKLARLKPDFTSVLEIGPGCGYLSFFLKHRKGLKNYSQIEACESFYILQSLVNVYCFGAKFDERCVTPSLDYFSDFFTESRQSESLSELLQLPAISKVCAHYPWWRCGEILSRNVTFDLVTSNANLLEFSKQALDDYLSLMHKSLAPEGIFFMQCTGEATHGAALQDLFERLYIHGFAPLFFVEPEKQYTFAGQSNSTLLSHLNTGQPSGRKMFVSPNAVFVKIGHPLFETYYLRENYKMGFIAREELIKRTFFCRPPKRKLFKEEDFIQTMEALMAERFTSQEQN